MTAKEILSAIAIALTFAGFYPYLRGIFVGNVRPHVFSWVIWGLTTLLVFLAQLDAHGGAGAWPTGVSGVVTAFVALLAWLKRGDVGITRVDCLFFLGALSSLPLWYLTADPLWAVVVLTVVDLLGFGPTYRKAWAAPRSESLGFYGLFVIRNAIAILALETWSLATVLFPAAVGVGCLMLMGLMFWRRRNPGIMTF